jgi:spore germination cell wall hydrolase CwlJ-like protein
MEWPIVTDSVSRADERAAPDGESRVFFRTDEGPTDRLGIINLSPPDRPTTRGPSRLRRRIAAALLAGGAIGLVGYGLLTSTGRNPGSIAARVPPPAANSAAATNLPPPNLLRPISPHEATKENAERPFVARPDSAASRFVLRTDAADRERALTCLAQAVYYEAAGEGVDGQRAVAQVVLNRLRHPGFPSTICGVVYEGGDRTTGCQFSFVCDGSMQRIPVPSLWARSRQIAAQALSGKVFAEVGHATHYHADYVLPYWADSLDKSVQLGHHIFYRLRSIFGEPRAFSQRYGGTEPQVRVPGAAVVIPPAAVTPLLANALLDDAGEPGPTKNVEKAGAQPGSPLLSDSVRGTLIADSGTPQHQTDGNKRKASVGCPAAADGKQLAPLGANDMRVSTDSTGC